MENTLFIKQCLNAVGKETSLNSIFSFYSEVKSKLKDGNKPIKNYFFKIYRAKGGYIRIEKQTQEQNIITIINGFVGIKIIKDISSKTIKTHCALEQQEILAIKRNVRLYPRNLLAHIDEHQSEVKELQTISGSSEYVLNVLDENVSYYFDSKTFLCSKLIDIANNLETHYSNYQEINGLFTPLEEKFILSPTKYQSDTIQLVQYNINLSDELFSLKV